MACRSPRWAFVGLAALATSGCHSGGTDALAVVSHASETTAGQHTAHVTVKGTGAFLGVPITGVGSIDFDKHALHLDFEGSTTQITIIGEDAYASIPMSTKWTHTRHQSDEFDALRSPSDPTTLINVLREVSSSVREVGHEPIRGVQTIHFHAEVNRPREEATDGAPGTSSSTPRSRTFPVDVWIGASKILRIAWTVPPSAGDDAGAASVISFAEDFSDFGVAVSISAPPAPEVVEQ